MAARERVRPAGPSGPLCSWPFNVLNRPFTSRSLAALVRTGAGLISPAPRRHRPPRTITQNTEIHNELSIIQIMKTKVALMASWPSSDQSPAMTKKTEIEAEMRNQCPPKAIIRVNFSQKSIAFHP
jgi:hypothetical protein